MEQHHHLNLTEFFRDIQLVFAAPSRRFAVIQERGAWWGSLFLLMIPAYVGFNFVGGIYFAHEPFAGYSFIPPLVVAALAVFMKMILVHLFARLFQGRARLSANGGNFSGLVVVFGYTGVPALLALVLALTVFLLIPEQMGYFLHDFRAVGISIMIAVGIALFIWNLILVVLALRTVYSLRDIKIVAAFILGSIAMAVPGIGTMWIVRQARVDFDFVQPVLSSRVLRFFSADPTTSPSRQTKIGIHLDRLAYRLREPERFELVAFLRTPQEEQKRESGAVVVGAHSLITWDDQNLAVGRIVGIPGDKVEMIRGTLYIGGEAWNEPYLAPEFRSDSSLPPKLLGGEEYFVLPDNRHLIEELKDDLVVSRDRIQGREPICRWPLGWWIYSPSVFLQAHPAVPAR